MKKLFTNHWPFFSSVLFLCVLLMILFEISRLKNNGYFVYSLDDAYIHMAMSKNLALHGIWGVTSGGFTSSSSSLLWTLLLGALFYIFGPHVSVPLILNIIFALLAVYSVYYLLKKHGMKNIYVLFVLLGFILLSPLPPLIFTGLEHVLHIFISILFIYFLSMRIYYNDRYFLVIILLGMLLPLVRYEGIVMVVAGSLLLLAFGKKRLLPILLFVFGLLPVFIFGFVSISNGWSFFPNSMVLKGGLPDIMSFNDVGFFLYYLAEVFYGRSVILILLLIGVFFFIGFFLYYFKKENIGLIKNPRFIMLILLLVNVSLYIVFAGSGWSYRYQSFLVALGIFVISYLVIENKKWFSVKKTKVKQYVFGTSVSLLSLYFLYQAVILIWNTPAAMNNIYEQQFQMACLIGNYYEGKTIALNDIGAVNYFNNIKCVDLWGLSNIDVSKEMRRGSYSENYIREITRSNDVDIAILYDSWFSEGDSTILPQEWVKAGEWKILNNVIAGDDVVSFYAVKPDEENSLILNLKKYSKLLPPDVIQSGKYMNR